MVEEADARAGMAAGALRYAAARMFEDGVGDLAAAMDHLQLALDEPPTATFRPVLRALRLHAVEAGSIWTAIDLLDVEMRGRHDGGRPRRSGGGEGVPAGAPAAGPRARPRRAGRGAGAGPGAHRGAGGCWRRPPCAATTPRCCRRSWNGGWRAATSGGERGRLLGRLALRAEANPERLTEALDLWLRALGEEAGRGAAALARAGTRRVAARVGPRRGACPRRGAGGRSEHGAPIGPPGWGWRRRWPGTDWGRRRARSTLIEDARTADPNDPALLFASVANSLAAGTWTKARLALDRHAELSRDRDWAATLSGAGGPPGRAAREPTTRPRRRAIGGCWRRARAIRSAWRALERIASRTGDAVAQVRLAEAAVDRSSEPAERAALAMRAAELAETAAHDLPRAAALARRALEAVPGYAPAAHLLERLYLDARAVGRAGQGRRARRRHRGDRTGRRRAATRGRRRRARWR